MSVASTSAPVATRQRAHLSTRERLVVAALSLCAITLLSVAAWLQPASAGMGTHTQLGIPACSWPATIGLPCPSCGMTTAFALAADGRFFDSFRAQPIGFCLHLPQLVSQSYRHTPHSQALECSVRSPIKSAADFGGSLALWFCCRGAIRC